MTHPSRHARHLPCKGRQETTDTLKTKRKFYKFYCYIFVRLILVTQLLWSMQENPVPTRAEVADIYNGVLDGAAALMLTGETAIGKHPVEAMTYLAKTARCAMRDMEEMQTQEET